MILAIIWVHVYARAPAQRLDLGKLGPVYMSALGMGGGGRQAIPCTRALGGGGGGEVGGRGGALI